MAEDMNGADREQEKQEKKLGNVIGNPPKPTDPRINEAMGDAGLETCLTAEDVARAGGYGARDDIGSFLPVASDSTDFEASLRDAQDFKSRRQRKGEAGPRLDRDQGEGISCIWLL
ncbi:hypothetical protein HPP92_017605 [Vanilla planifolia]|uniref:Uncharacterized protein n=1 Tax=Vanilla planifolia TaxID=51239 RepID=A0A835UNK9_VANPL|nr:hypothetical protein HPP92_017605 [Vanilla planifolia]